MPDLASLALMNDAMRRYTSARDHRERQDAWSEVQNHMMMFKAAAVPTSRKRSQRDMESKLQDIVDDELRWLQERMQGRDPQGMDWALLSERVAERVQRELYATYERSAKKTFREGIETAYQEMQQIPRRMADRDKEILERLTRNEVVSTAFANFSVDMSRSIREAIIEAYKEGKVSVPGIAQKLREVTGSMSQARMERIAHTETFKIFETARQDAYRRMERDAGEVWLYRFGTINDDRTCALCNTIMVGVPDGGLPMDELHAHIVRVTRQHMPKWDPMRGGGAPVPHPGCRHGTFRTLASTLGDVPVSSQKTGPY